MTRQLVGACCPRPGPVAEDLVVRRGSLPEGAAWAAKRLRGSDRICCGVFQSAAPLDGLFGLLGARGGFV